MSAAPRAVIFGCEGLSPTPEERAFFRDADPFGFILFARNVADPDQLARLTAELRDAVGRAAPVLVDQEGGRVQRLTPPHWRRWEDAGATVRRIGVEAAEEALRLRMRLIAQDLRAAGIDVNCAPVLDLRRPETTDAIGDRALSADSAEVARLGGAIRAGLEAGGVHAVIKHLPGHGRAVLDSHEAMARISVDRETLLAEAAPFAALKDSRWGMTCHLAFDALAPGAPATLAPEAIRFIRESVGFNGLLITDDLFMGALEGSIPARAEAALRAGCDVALCCHGDVAAMEQVAAACPALSGRAQSRAEAATAALAPQGFDPRAALARLAELDASPVEELYA